MTVTDPYGLMALPTEFWPASQIKLYAKNHKKHSKEQIATLIASIKEHGLMEALIVDVDGFIIAGHGRFEALQAMGQFKDFPVKHAKLLTKNQADAARIAHNKTASTEYDVEALTEEIERLVLSAEAGTDMAQFALSMGLTDRELQVSMEDVGEMNLGALSGDLDADMAAQETANAVKVADAAAGETAIAKVFGFKHIPVSKEHLFRSHIAAIELRTGKTGIDAWLDMLESAA
jgi:hypothetical protein